MKTCRKSVCEKLKTIFHKYFESWHILKSSFARFFGLLELEPKITWIYFVKNDRFLDWPSDFNSENLVWYNYDALKYHGIEKFEIRKLFVKNKGSISGYPFTAPVIKNIINRCCPSVSKNAFFRGKNVDPLGKISSGKKKFPAEKFSSGKKSSRRERTLKTFAHFQDFLLSTAQWTIVSGD